MSEKIDINIEYIHRYGSLKDLVQSWVQNIPESYSMSIAEIARRMKVPENTLRDWLIRGFPVAAIVLLPQFKQFIEFLIELHHKLNKGDFDPPEPIDELDVERLWLELKVSKKNNNPVRARNAKNELMLKIREFEVPV